MAENTSNPAGSTPASAPQRSEGAPRGQSYGQGHGHGGHGRGRPPRRQSESEMLGLTETVVSINRVSKTVKGGKRFSFGVLVVVGDKKGSVGCGLGKSKDIQFAIQKGASQARKSMIKFPIANGTIPHEAVGKYGAGTVWMKPAAPGTGVIAGGGARCVLEAAGVTDILAKSLGSNNHFSMVYATFEALQILRSKDDIMKLRGKA